MIICAFSSHLNLNVLFEEKNNKNQNSARNTCQTVLQYRTDTIGNLVSCLRILIYSTILDQGYLDAKTKRKKRARVFLRRLDSRHKDITLRYVCERPEIAKSGVKMGTHLQNWQCVASSSKFMSWKVIIASTFRGRYFEALADFCQNLRKSPARITTGNIF